MGMFDSLRIEIDGADIDLQTKRFDQTLRVYRVGDAVSRAAAGVQAYYDVCRLDEERRLVYGDAEVQSVFTVFVVVAHGVFVDYRVERGELRESAIEEQVRRLRGKWADSALLVDRLTESLRRHQARTEQLRHQIHRIAAVLDAVREPATTETHRRDSLWLNADLQRLAQGGAVTDVIASILADQDSRDLWQPEIEAPRSALETLRL
jgi:hypothetical protein